MTGNTLDSAFKLANLEKSIISFFRVVMERNILYKRVRLAASYIIGHSMETSTELHGAP